LGAGALWLVAQFPAPLKGWVAVCGWVRVSVGLRPATEPRNRYSPAPLKDWVAVCG